MMQDHNTSGAKSEPSVSEVMRGSRAGQGDVEHACSRLAYIVFAWSWHRGLELLHIVVYKWETEAGGCQRQRHSVTNMTE